MANTNPQTPLSLLKKFEDAAAACNRCGFCTSYCPTYLATGKEIHSPRGRNQMVRALLEGRVSNPTQAAETIDTCLLCGECTSVCFSEVPTADLMVQARHFVNQSRGPSKALNFFLGSILSLPQRFYWVLKVAFLGKNLGISWLLRKLGVLKAIAPSLEAGDAMVKSVPFDFLLDRKESKPYQEENYLKKQHQLVMLQQKSASPGVRPPVAARPKVAYMPVCGSQYVRPSIGLATLNLFKKLKIDFLIPEVICCGLPALSYGVLDQVRQMAKENIVRLEKGYFEQIVADDSSCMAHFRDYPKIFTDDQAWLNRAHALAQKGRELSSFLMQRGLADHLKLAPWSGGAVAYHDPCKAQYGQKSTVPPRQLLAAIPRLQLVPVTDADQCCGGGGTYSLAQPELSQSVLASKIKNIIASGCQIVVTSSASCLLQLLFGLRQARSKIQAYHLTEFLVRALEKRG